MALNSKSDLLIEVTFKDTDGNIIPVPEYDFELEYYVYTNRRIKAGKTGTTFFNCTPTADDKLAVVFDNPNLGSGTLYCERTYFIPDDRFPDGIFKLTLEPEIIPV